jgi:hypothetical protein
VETSNHYKNGATPKSHMSWELISGKMKNRIIVFTAVFLMISIGNYFRVVSDGEIRTVEFISIFAIGALSGVLITQIISILKDKNKTT